MWFESVFVILVTMDSLLSLRHGIVVQQLHTAWFVYSMDQLNGLIPAHPQTYQLKSGGKDTVNVEVGGGGRQQGLEESRRHKPCLRLLCWGFFMIHVIIIIMDCILCSAFRGPQSALQFHYSVTLTHWWGQATARLLYRTISPSSHHQ